MRPKTISAPLVAAKEFARVKVFLAVMAEIMVRVPGNHHRAPFYVENSIGAKSLYPFT